jgi:hypothetical protein
VYGRRTTTGTSRVVTDSLPTDNYGEFSNSSPLVAGGLKWLNYVIGVVAKFGDSAPSFDAAISSDVPLGGGLVLNCVLSLTLSFAFVVQSCRCFISFDAESIRCCYIIQSLILDAHGGFFYI